MKPKVVHVISGDLWGGAECQVYNLIQAQLRQNCVVGAILFNEGTLSAKLRAIGTAVDVVSESSLPLLSHSMWSSVTGPQDTTRR